MTIKNDDLHTPSPCFTRSAYVLLMTSQSIVSDITMTRQLWRYDLKHCIHGDIHGRLCKNVIYQYFDNNCPPSSAVPLPNTGVLLRSIIRSQLTVQHQVIWLGLSQWMSSNVHQTKSMGFNSYHKVMTESEIWRLEVYNTMIGRVT